jgi:protein-tyrosine kinase
MSIIEKALRKIQTDAKGGVVTNSAAFVSAPQTGAPPIPTHGKKICIDRAALRAGGMLAPESEERELSQQYRAIKQPLIRAAFGPRVKDGAPRQLILVASALPGEGKTFTTLNLALSMSLEKDHAVLLVDADVAKPHVSKVFGVDEEPGLLDVLGDTTRSVDSLLSSAILPTDVPGLSILPAGRRSETASELLASERMRQVVLQLASMYARGIVLFDSPPLLLTTEARILALQVGQVVVVVKADSTPQQAIKDTIALLEGAQNLQLVLNDADVSGPTGYYYGYNYGYASQPASTEPPRPVDPS